MVITYRSEIKRLGKSDLLLQPLLSLSYRLGTRVICQSNAAATQLIRFFPNAEKNTHVIPNWIDPDSVTDGSTQQRQENKVPAILFIGWLERNKGVHDLLDAISLIKKQSIPVKLVVGGSGSQHELLVAAAKTLGIEEQVSFLGWIANEKKATALNSANIFVLPSYSEGMPNSVLEAMACGLPVISTNVGGIPQLVCPEGSILVSPGSPEELAKAILELLNNRSKQQQMGIANQTHVKQEHDIRIIWPKLAHVLGIPSLQEPK